MAGWEEDLSILLRALGVKQEENKAVQPPTNRNEDGSLCESPPLHDRPEQKAQAQFADRIFWNGSHDSSRSIEDVEEDEASMEDLMIMRRQVESIVSQLVRLMQRADVDPGLKEDVMIVLQALRRRATATQQAAAGEVAVLEAVSAMVHFCRLVLRLDEVATED
jgi:hypothetical protein